MIASPSTPIAEYFESEYVPLRLPDGAKSTLTSWHATLKQFSKFISNPATLADLTDRNVTGFCWKRVEKGISRFTARGQGHSLLALWRFACQQGVLEKWPASLKLPVPQDLDPVAWTREQLRILFDAMQRVPGSLCGVPTNGWLVALHSLMWDTAERIGAVRVLQWSDINLETGMVTFRAKTRKGRRRDNTLAIHADTVEALKAIAEPQRDRIFPWPYCDSYLWIWYTTLVQRAGLPFDRRHKFHCMRRSSASFIEAAGMDATVVLGHSSRAITLRSYIDPKIVRRPGAAAVLFRPLDEGQQPKEQPSAALPLPAAPVAEGPDPDLILFAHEYSQFHSLVALNGVWTRVGKTNALLLESLFNAGSEGAHRDDLMRNLAITSPAFYGRLTEVKGILRKAFDLPADFNPVPRDTGARFSLAIKRSKKQERRPDAMPVREPARRGQREPVAVAVPEHDGFMV